MDDERPRPESRRPPAEAPSLFDALVENLDVQSVEQAEDYERGLGHIREIRRGLDEPLARPWVARDPCGRCNTTDAVLIPRRGQNTVRCARCYSPLYNAPKTETGEKPRTVKTLRSGIKPSQQARILDRDGGRCVLCGSTDELTLGHLLSIEDGTDLGATGAELNSDANLAAMCEGCNLGLRHGPGSVNPRTYAIIMWRLVQAELRHST